MRDSIMAGRNMTKSTLLLKMIDLLKNHPGITVDEIAIAMDRSERTIYRWLNELSADMQTPIYCSNGGYFLLGNRELTAIDLDPQEVLALRLSLKSSPYTDNSPIKKYADSAWSKIRNGVSSDKLLSADDYEAKHSVNIIVNGTDINPQIVELLERSVNEHRRLCAVYRSQKSNREKTYTIDPYAFVFRRHSWYLLAYSLEHEKVVQFKLLRFKSIIDTRAKFNPPVDFSLEDYFKFSWECWGGGEPVDVKIKFSPRVAEMICETKRHPTQKTQKLSDGSVVMEVKIAGIQEIASWIMSYGRDAVVLEPARLQNYILEHAKSMVSQYSEAQKDSESSLTKH